jgi:hypothetical protein
MSKKRKLFISLALVATTAFAVLPTLAQAAPRYTKNGAFLAEGAVGKTFLTGWGTLKLQTVLGGTASYECRNAAGGYAENPGGEAVAGIGKVELFTSYQCTFSACPTFPSVLAESLPWSVTLEEPAVGEFRAKTTGIKADLQCWATRAAFEKAGRGEAELPNAKNVFIGEQKPKIEHGTSATTPGFEVFNAAAGELEQEGSGGTIKGQTLGTIKAFGYEKQELINVR